MGATGRPATGCSALTRASVSPACTLIAGDVNNGSIPAPRLFFVEAVMPFLFVLIFHGFKCVSISVYSVSWADSFHSLVLWFLHLGQTT